MRVLITSGPTREPIDAVRYLSNGSTGRMGAALARAFLAAGHNVTFLRGQGSQAPEPHARLTERVFGSAEDLLRELDLELERRPAVGFLIHAAAVADYSPVPVAGKIPSGRERLTLTLCRTPKVADEVRARHPALPIALFKLEAGVSRAELHRRARRAMERVGAAVVVANLAEQVSSARHRADLLRPDGTVLELEGREAIAQALLREVSSPGGVAPAPPAKNVRREESR